MKNMFKTLLAIFSSLVISSAAFAGELSVSGSAEATYKIGGTDDSMSKGLGVSNELTLSASGEFGNGYTWSYGMNLDNAATANDDTKLILGLADMGTVAICVSDCGLSQELGYGVGAYAVGSDALLVGGLKHGTGDVSNYNNIQYHTPAGLLPFGISVKAAYAPNLADGQGTSIKEGGTIESTLNREGTTTLTGLGTDASMYSVTAAPIDGLGVGATYFRVDGSTATHQQFESGEAFVKYSMGPVVVGYNRSLVAPNATLDAATAKEQLFETDAYGIQFAVNEDFRISYNKEKSEKTTTTGVKVGQTTATKTRVEADVSTYQIAYNIGGATLAVVKSEASNAGYTTGKEVDATLISLKMAF